VNCLRAFIGYDQRQPVAFNIAQASIWRHCSRPVSITPLVLSTLPIERRGLTEFSMSRYLVPWLCGFEGHALFIDGDTLCMGDIAELPWDSEHAVSVVMHDRVRKNGQDVDVRFERPSVMLFNNAKCRALTPEYVQTGTPQKLDWAESIGDLPREWNYLVGYDSGGGGKLAHFTMGLPCFPETANDEYAAEWRETAQWATSTCSWAEIMGGSVHAKWKEPPPVNKFMRAQGFR
jgi:hypothetical protein